MHTHKAKHNKLEGYFWNSYTFIICILQVTFVLNLQLSCQSILHKLGHTFPKMVGLEPGIQFCRIFLLDKKFTKLCDVPPPSTSSEAKVQLGILVSSGGRQRCALPFGPFDVALARPARVQLGHPMWQSSRCVPSFCEDGARKTLRV